MEGLPDVGPHQRASKCPENIDPFGTFGSNYIFCGHLQAHWCGPNYAQSILSCIILQILTRFFSFIYLTKILFKFTILLLRKITNTLNFFSSRKCRILHLAIFKLDF